MMTHYIVQTASAPAKGGFGRYGRVALIEVELPYIHVSSISDRARGVVRIVQTWERRHIGTTERSAFGRALAEAEALCDLLNQTTCSEEPAALVLWDRWLEEGGRCPCISAGKLPRLDRFCPSTCPRFVSLKRR
jgi:hypothetical protein